MTDTVQKLGGLESLIDQLPDADPDDVAPGDGLTIVYESVHSASGDAKAVTAHIIGRDADGTLYGLEPVAESPDSSYPARGFVLAPDEPLRRYTHAPGRRDRVAYERATDAGHRPVSATAVRTLGDVLKLSPNDMVEYVGRRRRPSRRGFRLPGFHPGIPARHRETKAMAMCYRLFEATGGADCDHEFTIPFGEDGWSHAWDPDTGDRRRYHRVEYRLAWLFEGETAAEYAPTRRDRRLPPRIAKRVYGDPDAAAESDV